jgi:NAD(P)-dependent dehydrogenase (short-subunit alcohol dehydrogenase family)
LSWTIDGKVVLITGATSGIGLEVAIALGKLGARPIIVGRNEQRTTSAVTEIRERANVHAWSYLCDFSSQTDIRTLAAALHRDQSRIDVLVNNAGAVNKRRLVSIDGIEKTFATNHLGYFLLTTLLLDLIIRSTPARIVTVASIGHRRGTLDFDNLGFERGGYGIMRAYSRSKLANVLFANELARRLAGTGVTSNSLHPGGVATNIWSGAPLWTKPLIYLFLRRFFIPAEAGAQTIVQLAANPDLEGVTGRYFENQVAVQPAALAQDDELARRLWDVSEQLTRERNS